MAQARLDNPIINSAYVEPDRHHQFDDEGRPTGRILEGRRASEYFVPIPPPKSARGAAAELQLGLGLVTSQKREAATVVNDLRPLVQLWRRNDYPGLDRHSPSRLLLRHWRPDTNPGRERRLYFAQIEALESLIYLTEVADPARHDLRAVFDRLKAVNQQFNLGLPRLASKMATGSGKTAVMAMIIAWQTLNRAQAPKSDTRFCDRFLVVAPGITVRDRLRVLAPSEPRETNVYDSLDLVPEGELRRTLNRARVAVVNYHQFMPRTKAEAAGPTKKMLAQARKPGDIDPFVESPAEAISRVCAGLLEGKEKGLVVLNDEAHHCYRPKPPELAGADEPGPALKGEARREAEQRNEQAAVWFTGLMTAHKRHQIRRVFDVSATPFFLSGSGYGEGKLFPWVVSDFALIDAIESGIVKIPRVPVADNAMQVDGPVYRNVYAAVKGELPKRAEKDQLTAGNYNLPQALEAALQSLYGDYVRKFATWETQENRADSTPPVFIVVCNNTATSELVYRWIAGYAVQKQGPTGEPVTVLRPGGLGLFSNVDATGAWLNRPRTILVDSAELERGDNLSADFRKAAEQEIAAFKADLRNRKGAHEAEKLTEADLLREVLNTVGAPGKLGESVRCVVSVSMLTEGWDCNTVTNILGVRAFGTQLLCEQVIGRGLRRRGFAVDENDRFSPEYCEIYGVPFSYLPVAEGEGQPRPLPNPKRVRADPDRSGLEIRFPRVLGYRFEVPAIRLISGFEPEHFLTLSPEIVPTWTENHPVVGERAIHTLNELRELRDQEVVYHIARAVLEKHYPDESGQGGVKHWFFPQIVAIVGHWYRDCVVLKDGTFKQMLALSTLRAQAAEKIQSGIVANTEGDKRLMPVLPQFQVEGTTAAVDFLTGKPVWATRADKSHVSHVVCDTNSWEQKMAQVLEEELEGVAAYVKNDHLGFFIPYTLGLDERRYLPDFIVKTRSGAHLIVEVTGQKKVDKVVKADTARTRWVPAVNNHGRFGRWGFIEVTDPWNCLAAMNEAIAALDGGH